MKKLVLTPRVAVTGAIALASLTIWAYLMVGWARVLF
jgi:preprotein translocase subunit Sec61beta